MIIFQINLEAKIEAFKNMGKSQKIYLINLIFENFLFFN